MLISKIFIQWALELLYFSEDLLPLVSQKWENVKKSQTEEKWWQNIWFIHSRGGTALQLKHQKSADMKYFADNFEDNCQGWIFQIALAAFFRLSGPDFSLQIDRRAWCNQLNQTPLINAKCIDHIYVIACNNLNINATKHSSKCQLVNI